MDLKDIIKTLFGELMPPIINRAVKDALKELNLPKPTEELRDKPMGVKEASDFLGLAIPTLYGLTCKKLIPYSKPAKRLKFSKKDLLAWVESKKVKSKAEIDAEAEEFINKKGGGHV